MAQRGAPEPDPDPDTGPDPDGPVNSSAGPFLGAVAVIAAIVLIVFGAQFFAPAGEDLTDNDMVYRTVADYVAARNAGDSQILERLRCSDLPAEDAPLADVEGTVDLQATQNIAIEGDRATTDVRTSVGGEVVTETWQVLRIDGVWRVCEF